MNDTKTIHDMQIKALEATKACPHTDSKVHEFFEGDRPDLHPCDCKGTGRVPILGDELRVECKICEGRGGFQWLSGPSGSDMDSEICSTCQGRGYTPSDDMGAWMRTLSAMALSVDISYDWHLPADKGWRAVIKSRGLPWTAESLNADPKLAFYTAIYQVVEAQARVDSN